MAAPRGRVSAGAPLAAPINLTDFDDVDQDAAPISSGDALLAFKANHPPPHNAFGGAAAAKAILDDPSKRLAELDGFAELSAEDDVHVQAAIAGAAEASLARAQLTSLTTEEAPLAPLQAALEKCLTSEADDTQPPPELPVAVLPHLLLGDAPTAWDASRLRALGVTHVLNAADEQCRGPIDHAAEGLAYLQLDADDDVVYDMMVHRGAAAAFVRAARAAGGRCLVHCVHGINRSALLVAAELMLTERLPLLETARRLRRARGAPLLTNGSFRLALLRLAREQGLLGEHQDELEVIDEGGGGDDGDEPRALLNLPDDLLGRVLSLLDAPALAAAERACASLRAAARGGGLWRALLDRRWSWLLPTALVPLHSEKELVVRLHTNSSTRFVVIGGASAFDGAVEALHDDIDAAAYQYSRWPRRAGGIGGPTRRMPGSGSGHSTGWLRFPTAGLLPRLMAAVTRDASTGTLVALGGTDEGGLASASAQRFDGDAAWEDLPSLGVARSCAGAACDARGALICCGGGESMYRHARSFKSVERLPSGAGAWEAMPEMTQARCAAGLALSYQRDAIIACGGYGGLDESGEPLYLDSAEWLALSGAGGRWVPLPRMHEKRAGCSAAVGPDGRVYVLGGGPDGRTEHRSMEALDLRGQRWDRSLPPLRVGRHYNAAAFGPDGNLYVSGAFRHAPKGQLDVVERYDPRANRWEDLPDVGEVLLFSAGAFLF